MNERITYLVIGAAVGAAAGYFAGAVIDEIITQRQAASHDLIDWEDHEDYTHVPDAEDDDEEEKLIEVIPMAKEKSKKDPVDYGQYFADIGRPDIAALVEKYNGSKNVTEDDDEESMDADEYLEMEEILDESDEEDLDLVDPRIISLEEYANDSSHAHVILHYYDEDDILTDARRNPINKPEKLLGEDALVSFGELSEDEDIVYVRNAAKGAMYEVVRQNAFFQPPVEKKVKEQRDETEGDAQ